MMRRLIPLLLLLIMFQAGAADTYPNGTVRLVVPYAPGGGLDATARLIAQGLTKRLGQPVVVDNRPGGDGIVGTTLVAHAAPDGQTLLMVNMSHAINVALGRKLPYDTLKDFDPITQTNNQQFLLVTSPSLPVHSVHELVTLLKQKPGALNYGSSSNASALPMELFKSMTGTDVMQIPFAGTGPMLTAMLSGQFQMSFAASMSALPFIKSGKLQALAIGDSKRSALLPDVPTVAESGVPGFQAVDWNGIVAPAHTPPAIIARLNKEVVAVLNSPEVHDRMESFGSDVVGSTPQAWQAFIQAEIAKWTAIVAKAHMKAY